MGLIDSVKQVMKGRSTTVERGVDTALGHVGRFSDSLRRHADTVKERARSFDSTTTATDEPAVTGSSAPGGPASGGAPPAEPSLGESTLRGDLVEPDPTDGHPGTGRDASP